MIIDPLCLEIMVASLTFAEGVVVAELIMVALLANSAINRDTLRTAVGIGSIKASLLKLIPGLFSVLPTFSNQLLLLIWFIPDHIMDIRFHLVLNLPHLIHLLS